MITVSLVIPVCFFHKAAGLATMISTMRPDIDNIDEYVRNTTARYVCSDLNIFCGFQPHGYWVCFLMAAKNMVAKKMFTQKEKEVNNCQISLRLK